MASEIKVTPHDCQLIFCLTRNFGGLPHTIDKAAQAKISVMKVAALCVQFYWWKRRLSHFGLRQLRDVSRDAPGLVLGKRESSQRAAPSA